MLSNRPYLLNAFYQWIVDSGCVPLITANAHHPRLKISEEFIQNGEVVFNISPDAVRNLEIKKDKVSFTASFSGIVQTIQLPINSILSIQAEENGEGLYFDENEILNDEEDETVVRLHEEIKPVANPPTQPSTTSTASKHPFLKLVEVE